MINQDMEKFERWFRESSLNPDIVFDLKLDGNYFCRDHAICFIAWQAGRQLLKKEVAWRVTDIREMLMQRGTCDEWSTPVVNLNLLERLVEHD